MNGSVLETNSGLGLDGAFRRVMILPCFVSP